MTKSISLTDPQIRALSSLMQPGAMLRGLTYFELYTFKGQSRDVPCVPGAVVRVLESRKLIHKITDTTQIKIYSITRVGREYLKAVEQREHEREQRQHGE